MNITVNTITPNSYNNKYKSNMSFGSVPYDVPTKSGLLRPLSRAYDKFTTGISNKYTDWIYTSKAAKKLANFEFKRIDPVNTMQILGSTVISGMYILRTMQNDNLEDDKKPILALNQFLTFAVSTVLGLVIDSGLDKWWEKRTVKYLEKKTGMNNIAENIEKDYNAKLKQEADRIGKTVDELSRKDKKGIKRQSALSYLEKHEDLYDRTLRKKVMGMGVLKKLVIFSTIYRYISPVAVTPIANNIGEKALARKRAKAAAKEQD